MIAEAYMFMCLVTDWPKDADDYPWWYMDNCVTHQDQNDRVYTKKACQEQVIWFLKEFAKTQDLQVIAWCTRVKTIETFVPNPNPSGVRTHMAGLFSSQGEPYRTTTSENR